MGRELINGLPANVDIERLVLGATLLNAPRYLPSVRAALNISDFMLAKHQHIYRAMITLDNRGEKIDRVTVATELDRVGELTNCDGLGYLCLLDEGMPQLPNIDAYIDIVRDKAIRRTAIYTAHALEQRALLPAESTGDVIRSGADLFRILLESSHAQGYTYADVPSIFSFKSEVTYIIDELLPEGGITLLTGDSGHGKTLFATAMAGAIAHGRDFLGRQTTERKVLYLDRENPLALVKQHLFDLDIECTDNLIYWGGWCAHPADSPNSPSLLEFARKDKPVMIFDSLIAFHPGDEQSASETRRYLQHYRDLAGAGATIVLVHHVGKTEKAKQYRGSSDIKAAVDVGLFIEKLGEPAGLLSDLRLTPFKHRIREGRMLSLSFHQGHFAAGQQPAGTQREMLERIVSQNPNLNGVELVKLGRSAGLGKTRIEDLLIEGSRDGWLEVTMGKHGAKRYVLAPEKPAS